MDRKLILFLVLLFSWAEGTFLSQCKRGNFTVGAEIRKKMSAVLPEITGKYLAVGDKILADLVDKMTSSNLEPLVFLKPLLDQYVFPCVGVSKYLNGSLMAQSDLITLQISTILNHKYLSCRRVSATQSFLLTDLLESNVVMDKLDVRNLMGKETPLMAVLTSIHKLIRSLMGNLANTVIFKLPWLVKHAVANILRDVSGVVMNLVTNLLMGILSARSQLLLTMLSDCLEPLECTIVDYPEILNDPCEKIETSLENIFSSIYTDISKSLECLEEKYHSIEALNGLEDVTNMLIL